MKHYPISYDSAYGELVIICDVCRDDWHAACAAVEGNVPPVDLNDPVMVKAVAPHLAVADICPAYGGDPVARSRFMKEACPFGFTLSVRPVRNTAGDYITSVHSVAAKHGASFPLGVRARQEALAYASSFIGHDTFLDLPTNADVKLSRDSSLWSGCYVRRLYLTSCSSVSTVELSLPVGLIDRVITSRPTRIVSFHDLKR